MATNLVGQAFNLHQRTYKHICPYHYVSWNPTTKQWKCENKGIYRMWPYYAMMCFEASCIFVYLLIMLSKSNRILDAIRNGGMFPTFHVIAILNTFMVDFLFYTSGPELVYVYNWVSHQSTLPIKPKKLPNKRLKFWRKAILAIKRFVTGIKG